MLNLFVRLKGYSGFFVFDLLLLLRFFVCMWSNFTHPEHGQLIFCAATLGAVSPLRGIPDPHFF